MIAGTAQLSPVPLTTAIGSNFASDVEALDLERLDAAVEAAIAAGEAGPLHVLGYGEITLVLGWPTERPTVAVKRLPRFAAAEQLDRYGSLLHRYTTALQERGVATLPTAIRSTPAGGGAVHAYLVQPLISRADLLNHVLRDAPPARAAVLLGGVAAAVAGAVDERVGLDAQAANWVVHGDRIACLDLSTPMLRSGDGREELELDPFLSIYPAALRPLLAPVARGVMVSYHEPRTVLLDVASNLVKERLERWLPALLVAANRHVPEPITEAEVRRYFSRDKRLWLLMQRLRRLDRAWQRQVRRRPYPFLLAPPYRYGPPELPDPHGPERAST